MIINELTYQEIAIEASDVEGGIDLGFNYTNFKQHAAVLETASISGPGGSAAYTKGIHVDTSTAGLGAVVLGLPKP